MIAQAQTTSPQLTAVVVFGRDDKGKPHASSFAASEAALAEKAAALMGMNVLRIKTDSERALAAKLPKGRVFASGKGFVPFIKAGLFTELEAAAPQPAAPGAKTPGEPVTNGSGEPHLAAPAPRGTATASEGPEPAPVRQPSNWADIRVGAIVLASAAPRHMDWYECLVVDVVGEDFFTLRYCDWPKEPKFSRRRADIALMHPLRKPEPPLDPEQPVSD
ncbi:MAG TPA: hypothetical protein VGN97_02750 [Mesorhizobium sp.]|jgi:hypothetical protein|nr:hypothetical protein [Mesorhizobium sp.]